jgi:hypothetical protein
MGSRDSLFKGGNDQQMKQIDNRLVGINQRRSEFSLDWVNNAVIRFGHPFIFLLLGWKSLGQCLRAPLLHHFFSLSPQLQNDLH